MDQMVSVPGGRIHVTITGNGQPIVLLPGFGDPSPTLMMKPFADALSAHFQVIIYEPFGYGESGPAPTPRTVENISDELHQAMAGLGFSRYAVAAHSISGLYMLFHAHRYPGEMTAFIALDPSVPCQFTSEFSKEELAAEEKNCIKQLEASSDEDLAEIKKGTITFLHTMSPYEYSDEEIRQYEDMAVRCAHDPTRLDELRHMEENGKKAEKMTIPDDLPALMLIARENTKRMSEWEGWHRAICGAKTEVHILESDHYVHLQRTEEIVRLIEQMLL